MSICGPASVSLGDLSLGISFGDLYSGSLSGDISSGISIRDFHWGGAPNPEAAPRKQRQMHMQPRSFKILKKQNKKTQA